MTFHISERVVCIKRGDWEDQNLLQQWPVYGDVYTVRGFGISGNSLLLDEIINDFALHREGWSEPAFHMSRFRRVAERKADISIFTEIARKASSKIGEPA